MRTRWHGLRMSTLIGRVRYSVWNLNFIVPVVGPAIVIRNSIRRIGIPPPIRIDPAIEVGIAIGVAAVISPVRIATDSPAHTRVVASAMRIQWTTGCAATERVLGESGPGANPADGRPASVSMPSTEGTAASVSMAAGESMSPADWAAAKGRVPAAEPSGMSTTASVAPALRQKLRRRQPEH